MEAIVGIIVGGIMLLVIVAKAPMFQAIVALIAIFACLGFWGYSLLLSMKRQRKIISTVQQLLSSSEEVEVEAEVDAEEDSRVGRSCGSGRWAGGMNGWTVEENGGLGDKQAPSTPVTPHILTQQQLREQWQRKKSLNSHPFTTLRQDSDPILLPQPIPSPAPDPGEGLESLLSEHLDWFEIGKSLPPVDAFDRPQL